MKPGKKKNIADLNDLGKAKLYELHDKAKHLSPDKDKDGVKQFTPGLFTSVIGHSGNWNYMEIEALDGTTFTRPCFTDANSTVALTIETDGNEIDGYNINSKDVLNGYVAHITARVMESDSWDKICVFQRERGGIVRQLAKVKKQIADATKKKNAATVPATIDVLNQDLEILENEQKEIQVKLRDCEVNLIGNVNIVNNGSIFDINNYVEWSSDREIWDGKKRVYHQQRDQDNFNVAVAPLLNTKFQKVQSFERVTEKKGGKKKREVLKITEQPKQLFYRVRYEKTQYKTNDDGTPVLDENKKPIVEKVETIQSIKMDNDALVNLILSNREYIEYPRTIKAQTKAQRVATTYCLQIYKNNVLKNGLPRSLTIGKIIGILFDSTQRANMERNRQTIRLLDAVRDWLKNCEMLGIFKDIQILDANNVDHYPEFKDKTKSKYGSRREYDALVTMCLKFTPCREPFGESYRRGGLNRINREQESLFNNPLFLSHDTPADHKKAPEKGG